MTASATHAVDLNADLGEEITDDAGLLAVVTSANLACGYHAGSPAIMRAVCAQAALRGVAVGAQVSYDDRPGFGRVELEVPYEVLREQIADQVGTLAAIAASEGIAVSYVKPHGALYHRTMRDEAQARAVLDGSTLGSVGSVGSPADDAPPSGLPVLGMEGVLLGLARAAGRAVWREGFPDRGYDDTGLLLPRSAPGALIAETDAIVAHALELAGSVDSLCLHGDSAGAVDHARAVRTGLERAGWTLRAFS